jgi:hypothetical protein
MDELIAVRDDYPVAINGTYTLDILANDSYNGAIQAINALPALGAASAAITVEIIDNQPRERLSCLAMDPCNIPQGQAIPGMTV